MTDTIRKRLRDAVKTAIAGAASVAAVVETDDGYAGVGQWVRLESPDGLEQSGTFGKDTEELEIPLRLSVRRSVGASTKLEQLLADVRNALYADDTWAGLALNTFDQGASGFALQASKPWSQLLLRVLIVYRTGHGDPLNT